MSEPGKSEIKSQGRHSEEVDLRNLFQAIGNFFWIIWLRFVRLISQIRRVTLDNIVLLGSLALVCGVAGLALNQTQVPHYRTSMLLHSSIYGGQLIESSIKKLDLLCEDPERTELAKLLSLESEIAKQIKGFEAIPFVSEEEIVEVEILREQLRNLDADEVQISTVIDRIQIENKRTYEIVVRVFDNSVIGQLEEPIVSYFRKNPYVSKRLEVYKNDRQLTILKIQKEMSRLDSLKNAVYRNIYSLGERTREGSNNVILAEDNITNPLSIIREDMALYEKELENQRLLRLEPELEVVEGFTVFTNPESPGVKQYAAFGILIGIAIGYVFITLRSINQYLAAIEKEDLREKS